MATTRYLKQVLPLGSIEHPKHGRLDFTPRLLRDLVRTFEAGAMDQVALTLADAQNRHSDDPERVRGHVKRLEARDDGLYAEFELGDRGAALLRENPALPVSVRVVRPASGRFAGQPVLNHVCATLDPVAKGMRPWESAA